MFYKLHEKCRKYGNISFSPLSIILLTHNRLSTHSHLFRSIKRRCAPPNFTQIDEEVRRVRVLLNLRPYIKYVSVPIFVTQYNFLQRTSMPNLMKIRQERSASDTKSQTKGKVDTVSDVGPHTRSLCLKTVYLGFTSSRVRYAI